MKVYIEDCAHMLTDSQWKYNRLSHSTPIPTDIGVVRMHMKALKEPWQAGPVQPRQQLVRSPPEHFWIHDIIDRWQHMADWRPDRAPRVGASENRHFCWIYQDSAFPEEYSSPTLLWPDQELTPVPIEDAPTRDDSTDSDVEAPWTPRGRHLVEDT